MSSELLVNFLPWETRLAKLENSQMVEFHIERKSDRGILGNIYKARVSRVLPGMQAAFIDLGLEKTGFLHANRVVNPRFSKEAIPEKIKSHDQLDSFSEENEDAFEENEEKIETTKILEINISSIIKEGQEILVQVIKEPLGTKGPRLTGYVSIPGRFLVYIPDSKHIGVSKRIENEEERDRLKAIVEKHAPKQGGLIVRTVAEGASEKHIKDDLDFLLKLWGSIKKNFQKIKKTGLLYEDLDLSYKILRDRVTEDVSRVIVDDPDMYRKLSKFVQSYIPRFKKRLELHHSQVPIFEHFGVEAEIKRAIARKVWLKSGGYIIIDEAEALTSIDVNTGKFIGRRNLGETIFQTNYEAVKEIAYQIRLRNLGGIIVIDFIDMEREDHRNKLYEYFCEESKKDPVKTNIAPMGEFGLIELTRKRSQESIRKKMTLPCKACDGSGFIKSKQSIIYEIFRGCLKEAQRNTIKESLVLYCHPELAVYIANNEGESVEKLEKKMGCRLQVKYDADLHVEDFEIFPA